MAKANHFLANEELGMNESRAIVGSTSIAFVCNHPISSSLCSCTRLRPNDSSSGTLLVLQSLYKIQSDFFESRSIRINTEVWTQLTDCTTSPSLSPGWVRLNSSKMNESIPPNARHGRGNDNDERWGQTRASNDLACQS